METVQLTEKRNSESLYSETNQTVVKFKTEVTGPLEAKVGLGRLSIPAREVTV